MNKFQQSADKLVETLVTLADNDKATKVETANASNELFHVVRDAVEAGENSRLFFWEIYERAGWSYDREETMTSSVDGKNHLVKSRIKGRNGKAPSNLKFIATVVCRVAEEDGEAALSLFRNDSDKAEKPKTAFRKCRDRYAELTKKNPVDTALEKVADFDKEQLQDFLAGLTGLGII